jgi:hypothetical protein
MLNVQKIGTDPGLNETAYFAANAVGKRLFKNPVGRIATLWFGTKYPISVIIESSSLSSKPTLQSKKKKADEGF